MEKWKLNRFTRAFVFLVGGCCCSIGTRNGPVCPAIVDLYNGHLVWISHWVPHRSSAVTHRRGDVTRRKFSKVEVVFVRAVENSRKPAVKCSNWRVSTTRIVSTSSRWVSLQDNSVRTRFPGDLIEGGKNCREILRLAYSTGGSHTCLPLSLSLVHIHRHVNFVLFSIGPHEKEESPESYSRESCGFSLSTSCRMYINWPRKTTKRRGIYVSAKFLSNL